MNSIVKATPVSHVGQPFIRCIGCNSRAWLVEEWRPERGVDGNMRKFICEDGHQNFKVFNCEALRLLTHGC